MVNPRGCYPRAARHRPSDSGLPSQLLKRFVPRRASPVDSARLKSERCQFDSGDGDQVRRGVDRTHRLRKPHKLQIAGSTPVSATIRAGIAQLVQSVGLISRRSRVRVPLPVPSFVMMNSGNLITVNIYVLDT